LRFQLLHQDKDVGEAAELPRFDHREPVGVPLGQGLGGAAAILHGIAIARLPTAAVFRQGRYAGVAPGRIDPGVLRGVSPPHGR
jgi:hypothetical protein